MSIKNELKYPEGSYIKWGNEYLKVINNISDYTGTVMDMCGDIIHNFYFNYAGDVAELITDENKISELENFIK
ncbi:MAG TPA: hypothetical protein GXZ90_09115 [Clostridiales bacterium]|nr:hypothetical protein [Clostridiales bacterium]